MPALAWFAIVVFVITVSPGPGVLYVTARAVSQGRRAGFASMFGIESGELVWLVAVATGVAALLSASAGALTALRVGGAVYLVYLGIQRWRHAEAVELPRAAPIGRLFAQGLVTQLLNPKVSLFFIAFLPQFIDPSRPIAGQVAILGAVYIGVALAVDTSYVMASSALGGRLLRSRVAQKRTARASAATYVVLGVATAVSGAKA